MNRYGAMTAGLTRTDGLIQGLTSLRLLTFVHKAIGFPAHLLPRLLLSNNDFREKKKTTLIPHPSTACKRTSCRNISALPPRIGKEVAGAFTIGDNASSISRRDPRRGVSRPRFGAFTKGGAYQLHNTRATFRNYHGLSRGCHPVATNYAPLCSARPDKQCAGEHIALHSKVC